MPVLALHCSACKSHYYSKSEWLGHLLEERHQSLARLSVVNWGEPERSSALVVFARLPTGKDDKIIQYLSRDFGTYVVDFVWWPERPRVGFVRFESKEKAKEVLGSLHNHQFKIDSHQFCEVKDGGSISEIEWDGLLPESITRRRDSGKIIPEGPLSLGSGAVTRIKPKSEIIASEPQSCSESSQSGSPKTSNEGLGLRHHLSSIRKLVEIPDEEYDAAVDILHRVQRVLSEIQENHSWGRIIFNAVITRHWNLKLRHTPIDRPQNNSIYFSILIYKYMDSDHPNFSPIGLALMEHILNKFIEQHGKGMRRFLTYEMNYSCLHKTSTGGFEKINYTIKLPNTGHQFNFNISNHPEFMVDAQVWRLIKYLSAFDPHCIAVLSLVYHWAYINSLALSVGKLTRSSEQLGNPTGLNWLLIHFFQKQVLIPPVKLVLERPHKSQLYKEVDIGFSDCPKFVISWKTENGKNAGEQNPDDEEFAKMVFKLLYKFFMYCGTTLKKCGWIVNTRDAELISIQKLFSSGQVKNSKLSESELLAVKSTIPNGCREKFVMLNPFNINWRISVNNAEEVFRAMNVTGKKLKAYLTKKSAVEMNLEGFLQLLKV